MATNGPFKQPAVLALIFQVWLIVHWFVKLKWNLKIIWVGLIKDMILRH